MIDDALFLDCFSEDMPGVVTATWMQGEEEQSVRMHLFAATDMDGDAMRHSQQRYAAQVPMEWITGLVQGTKLSIDGISYTVTAKPISDGHGVATLMLERSRAT